MTTRNEAAHGRFSLTESKNRPPGSVGRCRKIDITWLIRSLSEKKRKWQAGRNLMEENKLVDDLMTERFTVGKNRVSVHVDGKGAPCHHSIIPHRISHLQVWHERWFAVQIPLHYASGSLIIREV
jgi:hypothetical protein